MLTALESGQHKAFFDLWNEVIPQHVRQSEGQKIEFYINIFFAIFPIHPLIKASKPHPLSEVCVVQFQPTLYSGTLHKCIPNAPDCADTNIKTDHASVPKVFGHKGF